MMERILVPVNAGDESSPLLTHHASPDIIIDIEPTALQEISTAISMLKRVEYKNHARQYLPLLIGLIVTALSIAGIVISAIPIDRARRVSGKWPSLMNEYNNYTGRHELDSSQTTCAEAFPLKNLCDFKSIKKTSNDLYMLAIDCYFYARSRCLWPEYYGVNTNTWPAFLLIGSCFGVLIGLVVASAYFWSERIYTVSATNQETWDYLRYVSQKYTLDIPHDTSLHDAQSRLKQKALEVSTPAKRRAFLSAGLPQYANQSSLHTFFKGTGKPFFEGKSMLTRAPREIQAKILDYAGLLPSRK